MIHHYLNLIYLLLALVHNNKLKKELEDLTIKMSEKCSVLNKMRSKYSKVLNEKINKELKDLEMKNASFCVDIKYDESGNFNQNGLDDIEFLIATNVGDEAKPLIKIASGGEISSSFFNLLLCSSRFSIV